MRSITQNTDRCRDIVRCFEIALAIVPLMRLGGPYVSVRLADPGTRRAYVSNGRYTNPSGDLDNRLFFYNQCVTVSDSFQVDCSFIYKVFTNFIEYSASFSVSSS
jgi:hypothetical protein